MQQGNLSIKLGGLFNRRGTFRAEGTTNGSQRTRYLTMTVFITCLDGGSARLRQKISELLLQSITLKSIAVNDITVGGGHICTSQEKVTMHLLHKTGGIDHDLC